MSDPVAQRWPNLEPLEGGPREGLESIPSRLAARIEELIASGELAAGARLPSERELGRIFQVSRLSVREAIQRLEALGLVNVRRGAGAFVASTAAQAPPEPRRRAELTLPTQVAVEELFEVRRLLEPAAAAWAARHADGRAIAWLTRLVEQFEEAATDSRPSFERLAECDVRLHLAIADAAGNALLAHLVERLHDLHRLQLDWSLRRGGRITDTAAEHRRLIAAIATHDSERAREAMFAHLAAAEESYRAVASTAPAAVD